MQAALDGASARVARWAQERALLAGTELASDEEEEEAHGLAGEAAGGSQEEGAWAGSDLLMAMAEEAEALSTPGVAALATPASQRGALDRAQVQAVSEARWRELADGSCRPPRMLRPGQGGALGVC